MITSAAPYSYVLWRYQCSSIVQRLIAPWRAKQIHADFDSLSHMQIYSSVWNKVCLYKLTGCTEIIVKWVNMHQFQKCFHSRLPDICTNNAAGISYWSEKLHSRVCLIIWKWKIHFISRFRPKNVGQVGGLIFVLLVSHTHFRCLLK